MIIKLEDVERRAAEMALIATASGAVPELAEQATSREVPRQRGSS